MLLLFKVTVAAAGTPGPLLGDGTNTTVTLIQPSSLPAVAQGYMGSTGSVVNNATRQSFKVGTLTPVGLGGNTGNVFLMPKGQTSAVARRAAPYEELSPMGYLDSRNDIDLGDMDVDASVNGEGWLIWAEAR